VTPARTSTARRSARSPRTASFSALVGRGPGALAVGLALLGGCGLLVGVEDVLPRGGSGATGGSSGAAGGPAGSGGASSSTGGGGGAGGGPCTSDGCPGTDCRKSSDCTPGTEENPNVCYKSLVLGEEIGVCAPKVPKGIWRKAAQEIGQARWWGPMTIAPNGLALIVSGTCEPLVVSCNTGAYDEDARRLSFASNWTKSSKTGAGPRIGATLASDGETTMLYGGADEAEEPLTLDVCRTWTDDDGDTATSCNASPGPRIEAAMVATGASFILFGGRNSQGNLDDTWVFERDIWVDAGSAGPSRNAHKMAYDAFRQHVVLFGGRDDNGVLPSNTYIYEAEVWSPVDNNGPGGRYGHELVHDPVRARTVMFGGATQTIPQSGWRDTWEWDGSDWLIIPSASGGDAAPAPAWEAGEAAVRGAAAWDPSRNLIVAAWGTEVWEYTTVGSPCRENDHCGTGVCAGGICCLDECAGRCDAEGACSP
jgi:hypothetical protein